MIPVKYHKIETLYKRDMEGTKELVKGLFRDPAVELLKNVEWIWTEKVDGTNIRVQWDGHEVEFGGRTDKATIPTPLLSKLESIFKTNESEEIFEQLFGDKSVVLFGEGYGGKIQAAGPLYSKEVDFILFDVQCGNYYFPREKVEEIAKALSVKVVPIVGHGTLDKAVEYVKANQNSTLGDLKMEGIVCRPKVELKDNSGNRLIVKIKYRDFKDD